MKDITLLVDSGSDYEPFLEAYFTYPVRIIPLHLYIDGKEYLDGVDISKTSFYKKMENAVELPKTSQPTPHNFYEIFKEELEKGRKVLYIGISSKLSGTIQSATLAKEMMGEKQNDIYIVDSQNVSAAILYLLFIADKLLSKGFIIEKAIEELDKLKSKIKLVALLDTLENLKKGGRVNFAQAAIGGLLDIKPLVTIENGLVKSLNKFRGRKKGLSFLTDLINKQDNNIDKSLIFFAHSFSDENKLKAEFNAINLTDFKEIIHLKIGTTIGTHAGNNSIGLVYMEQ